MQKHRSVTSRVLKAAFLLTFLVLVIQPAPVRAEVSVPQTDQTPLTPLVTPAAPAIPRYVSGFGLDDAYTVFYEDRNDTAGCAFGFRIYFNQTTGGVPGLAATGTATDICDTHLIVKNWPITIGAIPYAYRAWGSVGNNTFHTFYVSNNLTNWTQVYYGSGMFSDPGGVLLGDTILYGFHDVVRINDNYLGWVESATGRTYLAWSDLGDQNWTVTARVGGAVAGAAPLNLYLYAGITGPAPSGNFLLMELDGQITYVKLYITGDDTAAYLAINRAAAQAATPALAEAAFLNPANWTWRDGSTGLPGAANIVLQQTGQHNVREGWTVPTSDPRADQVILYTATYTTAPRGIGCAAADPQCLVILPPPAGGGLGGGGDEDPGLPMLIPVTGFAPGVQTVLGEQPEAVEYTPSQVRLEIPMLGVSTAVTSVPRVNGEWDVTWLGSQAGYLECTAFPTFPGNTAIAGHTYLANGLPGPFNRLAGLVYGDEVQLQAWGSTFIYQVQDNHLVLVDDRSVFRHEEYDWLTLLTCQGYDKDSGEYAWRRAVRAVLVEVTD